MLPANKEECISTQETVKSLIIKSRDTALATVIRRCIFVSEVD